MPKEWTFPTSLWSPRNQDTGTTTCPGTTTPVQCWNGTYAQPGPDGGTAMSVCFSTSDGAGGNPACLLPPSDTQPTVKDVSVVLGFDPRPPYNSFFTLSSQCMSVTCSGASMERMLLDRARDMTGVAR